MGLKEKHRLHLTIALVVVAIILIIAGAVMLGIGISKSNEKNTEVKLECQADQLNSFYISAWSANLNWPDCCNSDQNMINAKKNLTDQITSILKSPSSSSFLARHTFLSEITGSDHFLNEAALGSSVNIVKLTIDTITPAPMSSPGAVFYATLVTLGSPAPDATAIQNDLINGGFPSNVSGDPTQQCTGLKIPPGIPNLSTTTTPTTTTTAATVTTTGINDFPYPCGLPTISRAVLFLVDAASPTESPNFSMAFKLAYVQSYLTAMTPPAGSWNGLLMGVAVYYDTSAYIPDNFLCSTADCWTSMLGNVPRLQLPAQTVSHNVSRGLMFVYDEFSTMKQIPTGSSRTVILISDGFEFVDQGPIAPVTWAKNLMDTGFTVAAIVPTPINSVRQQMRALVSTRWYNYYEADSLSLLDNTAIVQYSAGWVCNALPYNPITTPASTTTNTQPPLILPTTTTTSGPPLTTPFPPKCANLSILFLIDESQSMLISNGWENAKNFVINVTQLFQQIPNAQFAWVTFNSKVWISTPFSDPTTFLTNVAASVFNTGATNFELGFNETLKTLQSVRTDRKPVLIFVSDGAPNIGGSVTTITQQMRCQLNTQIIGLGINEDAAGAAAIKSSIGVDDSTPGCVSASYNNIAGYENLVGQGLTAVLDELKCTNPPCSLNIVFAVEVSELVNVNGYITEQAAVITVTNQLIADNKISYYGDRIGLVYFSSPQNFNGNEMDKSGTLNSGYLTYNGEDFINKTKNLTTTLGGASDILLGLNLTYQMLMRSDAMTNGNLPTIVVMGRGKFKDADNCCDPPYDIANQILALPGATMQGVVLGPLNDPVIMAGITRRPNFYPKAGYDTSASNANDAGQALGTQIIAYLNAARNNGSCPPVNRESFCQQYMDIIIIMKSFNTPVNNSIATNFITKLLLKEFGGANIGPLNDRLTRIGFVHYHENADPELFPLDMYTSIDDIASAIMGIASHLYTPSGQTNMLSTAYNRAGDLLSSKARNQATSTIILITDQL
uniref:VWFA domain-containing protein n=1 Tax=Plectus sambesii TaxID=2011161 RepID=A0A914VSL4_9BILA